MMVIVVVGVIVAVRMIVIVDDCAHCSISFSL
jgi:hypothetical protein